MKIIRTIHPVGQGAFYSERFLDEEDNHVALVVYDCGSWDSAYLERELLSYFQKDDVIDILFISHFHKDHINGIAKLRNIGVRINTVVAPLISPQNRWFYIYAEDIDKELIDNPREHIGAEKVIFIEPIKIGQEPIWDNKRSRYIEQITDSNTSSGAEISSSKFPYWCYIPFNFDESLRVNRLKTELESKGIDITRLDDAAYIDIHKSNIRKAYEKVCMSKNKGKNINETSLIVFSGDCRDRHNIIEKLYIGIWPYWDFWQYSHIYDVKCGCLYLGDTDLKQERGNNIDILADLGRHLSIHKKKVGTIQLPHHGSNANFSADLFSNFVNGRIYFASHGNYNRYKHPSQNVVSQIKNKGYWFWGINNCPQTRLMEKIYISH